MPKSQIITSSIAADAVDNTILDLAGSYAFSGTITGIDEGYSIATASTSTNRTIDGVSSFVDHLTVTFTTTKVQTIQCLGQFSHGYENGQVMLAGRFDLDGSSQSTELQVFKQGVSSNMSFGAHNLIGFFTNVSAGSHTIKLQLKNSVNGTTAITNYFDDANNGDHIFVLYK